MALQKSVIDVPLGSGLDEKTGEYVLAAPRLSEATNVSTEKNGIIAKRRGFEMLSGTLVANGFNVTFAPSSTIAGNGSPTSAIAMVASQDEAAFIDPTVLFAYSETSEKVVQQDWHPGVLIERRNIQPTHSTAVYDVSLAQTPLGTIVYTWSTTNTSAGKVWATALDSETGAVVAQAGAITSNSGFSRTVRAGNNVITIYNNGGTTLFGVIFNDATKKWGSPIAILNANIPGTVIDVAGTPSQLVVAWNKAGTGPTIKTYNPNTLVATHTVSIANVNTITAIGVTAVDGKGIDIAFYDSTATSLYYYHYTDALVAVVGPLTASATSVGAITAITGIGFLRIDTRIIMAVYGQCDGVFATITYDWTDADTTNLLNPGFQLITSYVSLESRPVLLGDRIVFMCSNAIDAPGSYFLLEHKGVLITSGYGVGGYPGAHTFLGAISPRAGAPYLRTTSTQIPILVSSTNIVFACLETESSIDPYVVSEVTVTTDDERLGYSVNGGGRSYMISGPLCGYDGQKVFEIGFSNKGFIVSVTPSNGAGALTSSSTYEYCTVYRWADAGGNAHRSEPSDAFSVVMGVADDTNTLVIRALATTDRVSAVNSTGVPITVEVYRTLSNGATFYYEQEYDVINNSNAVTTITSVLADSAIEGNAPLYTTGGTLANQIPEAPVALCVHKNRVFTAQGNTVWFSQLVLPGIGARFNDELTFNVDDGPRGVYALASLDDKLVIFKTTAIWVLVGDGPSPNGLNSDYGLPIRISSDVGCISQRSIVVLPAGIVFMSSRGLMLLDRGLNVTYFGSEVEDTTTDFPYVFASVVLPEQNEARWSLGTDSSADTGVLIIYNYVSDIWTTSDIYDATLTVDSVAIAGFVKTPNEPCTAITTQATLMRERVPGDASLCLDGSHYTSMTITTPWVKPGGSLQGFGRVWRSLLLLKRASSHTLTVSFAYNYNPTYGDPRVFTTATLDALTVEQVLVHMGGPNDLQKFESFKVKIVDTAPTGGASVGTGEGFILSGIALETGVKKGGMKLPAAQEE